MNRRECIKKLKALCAFHNLTCKSSLDKLSSYYTSYFLIIGSPTYATTARFHYKESKASFFVNWADTQHRQCTYEEIIQEFINAIATQQLSNNIKHEN